MLENPWLVYPALPEHSIDRFLLGQCVINMVVTLLISKYCIFIFTPRYGDSAHAISLSTRDVPEKNLVTSFFCMTYKKKNGFQKPNPPSLAFGCALSSYWKVLPKYAVCLPSKHHYFPTSSIFPNVSSYSSFKTQFKYQFPQTPQEEFLILSIILPYYNYLCCLFILVDEIVECREVCAPLIYLRTI